MKSAMDHQKAPGENIPAGGLITKQKVRDFYEQLAPDADRYRKRNAYYYELLGGLLRFLIPEGQRVLDIGCGQGDFLNLLRPSLGVGVDLSPAMISRAKEKYPHMSFSVGDAEELALREKPFDYILLSNTVGYLQDIQKVFRGLRNYCTPDTRIVITHYNYLWEPVLKLGEWLGMKVREPYQNWLSISDIENLLSLEGFEVVRRRQAVLLPKRVPIGLCRFCATGSYLRSRFFGACRSSRLWWRAQSVLIARKASIPARSLYQPGTSAGTLNPL